MNIETRMLRAVTAFARRECGLRGVRGVVAVRVTGTRDLGGVFQCYRPASGGGQTSVGPNIHCTSSGACERRGRGD